MRRPNLPVLMVTLCALAACGSGSPTAGSATTVSARVAPQVAVVPATGTPTRLAEGRWVLGGVRAQRRGDGWQLAETALDVAIVGGRPVARGEGWRFFDQADHVYAADTYLGPLSHVPTPSEEEAPVVVDDDDMEDPRSTNEAFVAIREAVLARDPMLGFNVARGVYAGRGRFYSAGTSYDAGGRRVGYAPRPRPASEQWPPQYPTITTAGAFLAADDEGWLLHRYGWESWRTYPPLELEAGERLPNDPSAYHLDERRLVWSCHDHHVCVVDLARWALRRVEVPGLGPSENAVSHRMRFYDYQPASRSDGGHVVRTLDLTNGTEVQAIAEARLDPMVATEDGALFIDVSRTLVYFLPAGRDALVAVPTPANAMLVHFLDRTRGLALLPTADGRDRLAITLDGGTTWQPHEALSRPPPLPPHCHVDVCSIGNIVVDFERRLGPRTPFTVVQAPLIPESQ